MEDCNKPVDVISVISADGRIRPLRLRLEDENRALIRIDIDEILGTKEVPYVGVEAQIFLCRGHMEERIRTFQLKYSFRSHCWQLTHML